MIRRIVSDPALRHVAGIGHGAVPVYVRTITSRTIAAIIHRFGEIETPTYTRAPMSIRLRFGAPVVALLAITLLASCGGVAAPTASPSVASEPPTAAPSASVESEADMAARISFSAAICPIFSGLLDLDPRLQAIRDAGAAGGDMTPQAQELVDVGDVVLGLLEDLDALPAWQAGANLRYHLTNALHGIRAQLLHVGEDPAAASAADDLANLPFIATDAMDRAVQDAVEGGLSCEDVP
jgi:hypothetical protein